MKHDRCPLDLRGALACGQLLHAAVQLVQCEVEHHHLGVQTLRLDLLQILDNLLILSLVVGVRDQSEHLLKLLRRDVQQRKQLLQLLVLFQTDLKLVKRKRATAVPVQLAHRLLDSVGRLLPLLSDLFHAVGCIGLAIAIRTLHDDRENQVGEAEGDGNQRRCPDEDGPRVLPDDWDRALTPRIACEERLEEQQHACLHGPEGGEAPIVQPDLDVVEGED
mmetsp:Transcript_11986/g.34230  ORF Transcript_11986/g.34230 Transcript_11986/m.34230 type:complete len:220 (+) Transcript_11986:316-975(+)